MSCRTGHHFASKLTDYGRGGRGWLVMAWLMLAGGYAMPPDARAALPQSGAPTDTRAKSPRLNSFSELQSHLLAQEASLDRFRLRGPFEVATRKGRVIRVSENVRIRADLYLASPAEKAPLVIFLHGHDVSKEAHSRQAMHVASWGMHAVSLQLSKTGPWDNNGRTLARVVNLIHRSPGVIDPRIDVNRIILVGHSFGSYAVTVAMAQGAPVAGGILLDTALFGNASPDFLQKIDKPVMLLGADEALSPVRYRDYFYHYIPGNVAEISIRDATHEDAQYPSETSLQNAGVDPDTTEELQVTFVSAITSAAFSLSATRRLDYAWASFRGMIDSGKMLNPKKK